MKRRSVTTLRPSRARQGSRLQIKPDQPALPHTSKILPVSEALVFLQWLAMSNVGEIPSRPDRP